MLDVIDRDRKTSLGVSHDAVRHFAGCEPGVVPDHADHGNVDVREDVDRSAQDRNRRKDDD